MASTATPRRTKPTKAPILGVGDSLGAGDSYLVTDLLPEDQVATVFETLKNEVAWQTMFHRGGEVPRLVAVQGEVDADGSFPVYRHPADESPPLTPFTPTVDLIRGYVQQVVNHPVNHVLIQLYRSGKDYISDHSDKTIDVVRGSNIVNVSLGAQRVMTLRLKKDKNRHEDATTDPPPSANLTASSNIGPTPPPTPGTPRSAQKIPLPHNSMFVMGLETNAKWLHGINHDNRPPKTKSAEELAYEGARISLTFRQIGTFLTKDGERIWGQGAKAKDKGDARKVVYDDEREVERIIMAFGDENQRSDFDWDTAYGEGFDVLHFATKEG